MVQGDHLSERQLQQRAVGWALEAMATRLDWYAVLGVGREASPAEIRAAYKRRALEVRPRTRTLTKAGQDSWPCRRVF